MRIRHNLRSYCLLTLMSAGMLLFAATAQAASTTVKFSVPPWPGVTVKTEVVKQLFTALGYHTTIVRTSATIAIQAVSRGDADVELATWIPSQKSTLESIMKKGHLVVAGTNLRDARYDIVVPTYVWKAGVHSIADLHKYPNKFGRKIYGIDSGSDGNELVKKAIDNGTYNLQGWKVVASSTAGMLAQAGHAVHAHRWIAFLGWEPHWMNIVYSLKYLQDPKDIWGGKSVVYSIANKEFLKKNPNIAKFLKQFVVASQTQSKWIYQYGFKKENVTLVAKRWIAHHKPTVNTWLEGVTTVDGKPASAVIDHAFPS